MPGRGDGLQRCRNLSRRRPRRGVKDDIRDRFAADAIRHPIDRVNQGLFRGRIGERADGGDAAGERRHRSAREVIDERRVEMSVWIDPSRQHELAAGVDDPRIGRWTEVGANLGDGLARDADIGVPDAVGVDHPTAANQELGRRLPHSGREPRGRQRNRSGGEESHGLTACRHVDSWLEWR